jgi:hypothetical protein
MELCPDDFSNVSPDRQLLVLNIHVPTVKGDTWLQLDWPYAKIFYERVGMDSALSLYQLLSFLSKKRGTQKRVRA